MASSSTAPCRQDQFRNRKPLWERAARSASTAEAATVHRSVQRGRGSIAAVRHVDKARQTGGTAFTVKETTDGRLVYDLNRDAGEGFAGRSAAEPQERDRIGTPLTDFPSLDLVRYRDNATMDVVTTDLFSWLAEHIRGSGRDVVGVAILVNASRMPDIAPTKFNVNRIRQRFGDVIRDELGIEPAALTAAEAVYE